MKIWRMFFRAGTQRYEMWPNCIRLGVAAVNYHPLTTTDFSKIGKR